MSRILSRLSRSMLLSGALCVGAVSGASAAAISVYTDLAAWTAAVSGNVVIEDFSDATLLPGFQTANGGISGGAFFGTALTQFNDLNNPRWNFATSTAFGADFDLSPGGRGDSLVLALTFGDGTIGQAVIANPANDAFNGFFGIVSDAVITAVRFDSPGTGQEAFSADNVRFISGDVVEVPEPGSLGLALAALGLGWGVRRRVR